MQAETGFAKDALKSAVGLEILNWHLPFRASIGTAWLDEGRFPVIERCFLES